MKARNSIKGASMVEFALIAFIFFLLIFAIIDFGKFLAVEAVLNKSAQEAAYRASVLQGINIDTRGLNLSDPDDAALYAEFVNARNEVIQTGREYALSTFVKPPENPSGFARLVRFNVTNLDGTIQAQDALLLRPEESATVDTPSIGEVLNHPTVPPPPVGSPVVPFGNLLRDHPLYVELRADVFMILPFFDSLVARGKAFSFRERFKSGSFPEAPVLPTTTTVTTTSTTSSTLTPTTTLNPRRTTTTTTLRGATTTTSPRRTTTSTTTYTTTSSTATQTSTSTTIRRATTLPRQTSSTVTTSTARPRVTTTTASQTTVTTLPECPSCDDNCVLVVGPPICLCDCGE